MSDDAAAGAVHL